MPLVLHVISSRVGDLAAEVALDHAKREIDAGGKSAGAGEIAIFDEPGSALEVNIWELHGKGDERRVKCSRGFA